MKQRAPSTARNREPIRDVLAGVLPASGLVLEIASGTGEHAVFLAAAFPRVRWQPTDADPVAQASIAAWCAEAGLPNLLPPLALDVTGPWPVANADVVVCINMVHISPWTATLALLTGAARVLPSGAPLVLYGPYHVDGTPTAPSNAAFDESLRARNPEWGVRHLEDVERAANAAGFALAETIPMPANNFTLVFRRSGEEPT